MRQKLQGDRSAGREDVHCHLVVCDEDRTEVRLDRVVGGGAEVGDLLDGAGEALAPESIRRRTRSVIGPGRRVAVGMGSHWQAIATRGASAGVSSRAGRKLTSPMKSATKRLAGFRYRSAGGPIWAIRPCSITTISSEMARASAWS